MNKRLIYGGIAGGVFAFFFGWLLFGIILAGTMESMATEEMKSVMLPEEEMNFPAMIVSNLALSFLISYVFHGLGNVQSAMKGALAGAIITLLMIGSVDLGYMSMTTLFDLKAVGSDLLTNVIWGAGIGAVVAWVGSKVKD